MSRSTEGKVTLFKDGLVGRTRNRKTIIWKEGDLFIIRMVRTTTKNELKDVMKNGNGVYYHRDGKIKVTNIVLEKKTFEILFEAMGIFINEGYLNDNKTNNKSPEKGE